MVYASAWKLADEIRASEEYQIYHRLKETVMAEETQAALIREYRRLQISLQMRSLSGQQPDGEETQRFSALSGLLFSKPEVRDFLLSEMRLQQALADIFKIVTEAADVEMGFPAAGS